MNYESWSMVDFNVPTDIKELVSDTLWTLGVVAIEERDSDESLTILRTSMGEDPSSSIEFVTTQYPEVTFEIVQIPRSVADTWRAHAVPTLVTDNLYLVPAWLSPEPNSDYVLVEPLDTFGLGNHPTTVLALRLALQTTSPNSSVFDLGSGSGVLGIALAKFLQCSVLAYDIADSARDALRINSEFNNVSTAIWREGIVDTLSDVVLANILAPVLISEANDIISSTRVGGTIVLSGMRSEQVERVLSHYPECDEIKRDTQDGWTAVVLQRKN